MTPTCLQRRPSPRSGPLSRWLRGAAFALLALPLATSPAHALGELLITPTRVALEGSQRTAAVTLTNTGQETATYRISLVRRRMLESGELVEIDEPLADERFADTMFRYSPREVALPAGSTQTIRLQVRKPANLEAGEYRCHLMMRAVPSAEHAGKNVEALSGKAEGVSVKMTPIFGFTIPLIVRHGPTAATAELKPPRLHASSPDGQPARIDVSIARQGTRSLYGTLVASFTPAGGKEQELSRLSGVSVYVPNMRRHVSLTAQIPSGLKLQNGRLRVAYLDATSGSLIAANDTVIP